ncbi:MAG: HPr family phosphocarrier protein [Propionibacteriaceae bacterium]|jgi:phosphocarrier protein FPr|nr:HPr family phosphocarrier protein [Propionibacteriaceae bacterium]
MIGIVVVSHSMPLAEAAVALAEPMAAAGVTPPIAVAAGVDGGFGTDATAISEAISLTAEVTDGVLILVDLGSAILSSEMALELVDPDLAARTRISPAPLVEGLVAAVVTASTGADLATCAAEAEGALSAKRSQLGLDDDPVTSTAPETTAPQDSAATADSADAAASGDLSFDVVIADPHGLHARPAGALVSSLGGLNATVTLTNTTTGKGPVSAASLLTVMTLGVKQGDTLHADITGPEAATALERLESFASADAAAGQAG